MELLSVIRRWHYRDRFSIREISRRTGLSRNTVRKYLRSDSVEPKFNIPDRPSKLDPYADRLSHMLLQEAGKSRKQKRTAKQLHADLAALGYDGSYNRVAAFARDWKAARQREQKTAGRGGLVPLGERRAVDCAGDADDGGDPVGERGIFRQRADEHEGRHHRWPWPIPRNLLRGPPRSRRSLAAARFARRGCAAALRMRPSDAGAGRHSTSRLTKPAMRRQRRTGACTANRGRATGRPVAVGRVAPGTRR